MATIVISGPMEIYDDGKPITEPSRLRALHGVEEKGAKLADYLEGDLAHLGIAGGALKLAYDVAKKRLLVVSTYESPKRLNAKQLKALVEYTRGQWSDGVGESAFSALDRRGIDGIDLTPLGAERQIRLTQSDQGGRKLKSTPALLVAAERGELEQVQRLLEQGADPGTSNKAGQTALHLALLHGRAPVVTLLVKLGADVNRSDKHGETPLAVAATGTQTRLAKLLIDAGARVDCADKQGVTPLMWAANRGNLALVKLLLASGADPNARDRVKDNAGATPLMYVLPGSAKVIDVLVAHGADPMTRNARKQTAIEHAREQAEVAESFGERRQASAWRKQAEYLQRILQ